MKKNLYIVYKNKLCKRVTKVGKIEAGQENEFFEKTKAYYENNLYELIPNKKEVEFITENKEKVEAFCAKQENKGSLKFNEKTEERKKDVEKRILEINAEWYSVEQAKLEVKKFGIAVLNNEMYVIDNTIEEELE